MSPPQPFRRGGRTGRSGARAADIPLFGRSETSAAANLPQRSAPRAVWGTEQFHPLPPALPASPAGGGLRPHSPARASRRRRAVTSFRRAAEGPGPEAEGEPGPGAARGRPEPGPVSGTARMSEPELLLDSNIRLWVVLPIVFITFFVGMIRHYVSILLQSDKRLTQEQVSDRSGPPPSGPPQPRTPRPPENLAPPPRTCLSPGSPGPLPPAGRRGQRQARSRLRPCR